MIEPIEQIFKTFGFFGLFVAAMVMVIITLYKRSEKQHEKNVERIEQLEAARDKQTTEERQLLLKALEDNTRAMQASTKAMRHISYYIKRFKENLPPN